MSESYFLYHTWPFKIEDDAEGNPVGYLLDVRTGQFDRDDRPIPEVLSASPTGDHTSVDRERFIWRTEEERALHLTGDGPVFALYETIDAIYEQKAREGRKRLTAEELALVRSLRRRTFGMWEEEAARRAAGEPPTFTVRAKTGKG